ncbi:hypothetical protein BKA62DRAFT_724146, partial [Auriculariales sp. MPI-PUGE-AT-0066]
MTASSTNIAQSHQDLDSDGIPRDIRDLCYRLHQLAKTLVVAGDWHQLVSHATDHSYPCSIVEFHDWDPASVGLSQSAAVDWTFAFERLVQEVKDLTLGPPPEPPFEDNDNYKRHYIVSAQTLFNSGDNDIDGFLKRKTFDGDVGIGYHCSFDKPCKSEKYFYINPTKAGIIELYAHWLTDAADPSRGTGVKIVLERGFPNTRVYVHRLPRPRWRY